MRVSCQAVGPKEGLHVREHAKQAVLAEVREAPQADPPKTTLSQPVPSESVGRVVLQGLWQLCRQYSAQAEGDPHLGCGKVEGVIIRVGGVEAVRLPGHGS